MTRRNILSLGFTGLIGILLGRAPTKSEPVVRAIKPKIDAYGFSDLVHRVGEYVAREEERKLKGIHIPEEWLDDFTEWVYQQPHI